MFPSLLLHRELSHAQAAWRSSQLDKTQLTEKPNQNGALSTTNLTLR